MQCNSGLGGTGILMFDSAPRVEYNHKQAHCLDQATSTKSNLASHL